MPRAWQLFSPVGRATPTPLSLYFLLYTSYFILLTVYFLLYTSSFIPTRAAQARLIDLCEAAKVSSFADATVSSDFASAASTLVNCTGLGPLRANTVLLGWCPGLWESDEGDRYARELVEGARAAMLYEKGVLLHVHGSSSPPLCEPTGEGDDAAVSRPIS